MSKSKEIVKRVGNYAFVKAGESYRRPGEPLCHLENTGNGYIAYFPSNSPTRQAYFVCLDYAQAHDLILALSMFKKELGFV